MPDMCPATHTTPSLSASFRSRANSPGVQLIALVRWAVRRRMEMIQWGWNRLPVVSAQQHCNKLMKWAGQRTDASRESMLAFDRELGASLRFVIPGKPKRQEYDTLIKAL